MTDPTKKEKLPITILTANLLPAKCGTIYCLFSYADELTPIIYQIRPSITAGNRLISYYGVHRITDTGDGRSPDVGDLRYQLIGGMTCSNLDISQSIADGNAEDSINCKTFLHQ